MRWQLAVAFVAAVTLHALVLFAVRTQTDAHPLEMSDQPPPVDVTLVAEAPEAEAAPAAGAPSPSQPAPTPQQPQPAPAPQPTPEPEPQSTPEPQPTPETTPPAPEPTPKPTAEKPDKPDVARAESIPPKTRQKATSRHQRKILSSSSQQTAVRGNTGAAGDGPVGPHASHSGNGSGNSAARYRSNPEPIYPEGEKMQHHTGLVLVRAAVDQDGHVDSVSVIHSSGFPALDEAALQAVRHWLFYPARSGGLPVSSSATVPVRFRLTD